METTKIKYSIKKSFLNSLFDYVFFIFGFYLLSLVDFDDLKNFNLKTYFFPILSVVFILAYGKSIFFELLNLRNKIIFSKNHLEVDNKILSWSDISKPKIISKKEYTSKYKIEYEEYYLSLFHKKEKIEIKIDNYSICPEEFKTLLNKYTTIKYTENFMDKTLNNIIGYEEYFELNENEAKKKVSITLSLCENNLEELIKFCENNLFTDTDKVNFIYYCLSNKPEKWDTFLTNEFLKVYKMSIINNDNFDTLYPVLENIIVEDIDTIEAEKVRTELFSQINSSNLLIRLRTIQLINFWVDNELLNKFPTITSKLKLKLKDDNWKVRWNAHNVLKENEIEVDSLGFMDRIRAKYQNQYDA